MRKWIYVASLVLLTLSSCQQKQNTLIIFHAGSLSIPFQELADTFELHHSDIRVQLEADGSVACARKITELNRKADIMASADIKIINKMLIPEYADSAIAFAGNEMVIAFHENSTAHDTINAINWPGILLNPDIRYGRSNPDLDPCGYRTVLVMKLQEKYITNQHFVKKLLNKDKRYIRPKETDLLALLETNTIDYMFIYKSVAQQHNLKWIELQPKVNLSSEAYTDAYQSVSIDIKGNSPEDTLTISGSPMTYGICKLKNAPNTKAAEEFIQLLLSKKGQKIITNNGQNSLL